MKRKDEMMKDIPKANDEGRDEKVTRQGRHEERRHDMHKEDMKNSMNKGGERALPASHRGLPVPPRTPPAHVAPSSRVDEQGGNGPLPASHKASVCPATA